MKMTKKRGLILSVILAAFVWGVIKYFSHSENFSSDAILVNAEKVKVVTLPLEAQAIGAITAQSVEISPEVSGHIKTILFQDGSFVKAGTPLIQLDDAVVRAQYESAKAKLIYSEHNFQRMTLLGKQGAISRQAIDQADADLKEKKADAKQSEVMLSKTTLVAPFDGVMGKAKINPGDYVNVGQALVTITNTSHLHVEYNVPEKYLPLVKKEQIVNIKTESYPDKLFKGTVTYIAPTINTENRSISIYAELPNTENQLAGGMFVNVTHALGKQEKVLMIPARSLMPVLEGEQVYKVVEGKVYAVPVTIGMRSKDQVQIIDGLTNNDVVVTDGQFKLKNGMAVKIKS